MPIRIGKNDTDPDPQHWRRPIIPLRYPQVSVIFDFSFKGAQSQREHKTKLPWADNFYKDLRLLKATVPTSGGLPIPELRIYGTASTRWIFETQQRKVMVRNTVPTQVCHGNLRDRKKTA